MAYPAAATQPRTRKSGAGAVLRLAALIFCGATFAIVSLSLATVRTDPGSDESSAYAENAASTGAAPDVETGTLDGLTDWLFGSSDRASASRTGNTSWDRPKLHRMPRNRVPVRHGGVLVSN